MTRAERAAEAARLRAEGLLIREVAERMGVSLSYAHSLLKDPDGSADRARKDSYADPCVECGAKTSGSNGHIEKPRCVKCAARAAGAAKTVWTREAVIAAMRAWHAEFGEAPSVNCWGMAAYTVGDEERQAVYRERNAAGLIPHAQSVIRLFGTWNAGVVAAGLKPRVVGGGGGNGARMRSVRRKAAA